ncbi:hypothetical protein PENTCL1PPCAC_5932, partial [Pristionchus entomophagus]
LQYVSNRVGRCCGKHLYGYGRQSGGGEAGRDVDSSSIDARPSVWTQSDMATETVDNEGMGKRKSKCCCIYKKKRKWNDDASSDESDCETGSCKGHVEKRLQNHHDHDHGEGGQCT